MSLKLTELFDRLFCVSFAFYCGVVSVGGLNTIPGKVSIALTIIFLIAKWICKYVNANKIKK